MVNWNNKIKCVERTTLIECDCKSCSYNDYYADCMRFRIEYNRQIVVRE